MLLSNTALYLLELGFFPQHSGFGYLVYAINVIASDPMGYYSGKSDIFKALANEYGVSENCAKRCMNYSIRCAWQVSHNKTLHSIFPGAGKDYPPALNEFMCRAAIELSCRPGGEQRVGGV